MRRSRRRRLDPAEEAGRVRRRGAARPNVDRSAFAGFRFPPEVIAVAVRWYLRYGLSYRDVEELLAERGVEVDHVTVLPVGADGSSHCSSTPPDRARHATGDRWFVDEVRHEAPWIRVEVRDLHRRVCRSRPVEAGGSLIRETPGRVGSSPDNDGTGRYCQTARVRLARRKGVREEPASESPSSEATGSNLADVGWAAANSGGWMSPAGAPGRGGVARPGGHGEGLRRTRGWPLGHSWAPTPSRESVVNVGTVPAPPVRPASRVGGGQARRQLDGVGAGRSRRSSPRSGKPTTWRRAAASSQWQDWKARRSPVNTDAPRPSLDEAKARVLGIQTKLHRWATADAGRRFDDLFNLVTDPAFLLVAWERVRTNRGARTAGVDGVDGLLHQAGPRRRRVPRRSCGPI